MIACQIGCSAVAICVLELARTFPSLTSFHLFGGYLMFICIPCSIVYFFFLPCRRRVVLSDPTSTTALTKTETGSNVLIVGTKSEMAIDPSDSESPGGLKHRAKGNEVQSEQDGNKTVLMKGNWTGFFNELLTWDVQIFSFYYILQLLQVSSSFIF